jgi:hypothetical protein
MHPQDTREARAQLGARLARVNASKETAIDLMNTLAPHVTGRIITNRHPGADTWHLEIDQTTAREILNAITHARHERPDPRP